ncbi:MAG: NAD(P)H-binding protein [Pseudomonadota bacterium]
MTNKNTAIILGANGLVGRALVNTLCQDDRYTKITCLVRAPLANKHFNDPFSKLEAIVIDFDFLQDYQGYFTVDHVYCCLGTTMKKAGSKEAFRRVDFEFVHAAAQMSGAQRAKSFVWISSIGANAKSRNFYLRVKGELENAILTMPHLASPAAVQPPLLDGKRDEYRPLEETTAKIVNALHFLMIGPLKKYLPVKPQQVALEMIKLQKF